MAQQPPDNETVVTDANGRRTAIGPATLADGAPGIYMSVGEGGKRVRVVLYLDDAALDQFVLAALDARAAARLQAATANEAA